MKYLLILLFSIGSLSYSKAQTEVILGEPYTNQNILVIKNKPDCIGKLSTIKSYSNVSIIKLVDFNDEMPGLDTVIGFLSPLAKVEQLFFVNCNLLSLTSSLEKLSALQEVHVLNGSDYFENTLFPLLKNNSIKQLFFEAPDAEVISDSLGLLRALETIHMSGKGFNAKPANSYVLQPFGIKVFEYGGFVELSGEPYHKKRDDLAGDDAHQFSNTRNFGFIKQPIPGIKINDTLYTFESSNNGSFDYYSGSKISVDKNSFVYENGTNYEGPVKIFYREFRNPVEIMLSGIPMVNTEGGQTNLFKSGGMYQIEAFDTNDKKLLSKNDTAIKIDFALTDTASNFKFYSLNNNGHWDVTDENIKYKKVKIKQDDYKNQTLAVWQYYRFLYGINFQVADTTPFATRFEDNKYLNVYRKDNLPKGNDSAYYRYQEGGIIINRNSIRGKGFFRVRYKKLTKDKELIFVIVPSRKNLVVPGHISALFNKSFMYTGDLSPAEFKKQFGRLFHCWDLRNETTDGTLTLKIKAQEGFAKITAIMVNLDDDGKYKVLPKATRSLNLDIERNLLREEKAFNLRDRFSAYNHNNKNKLKLERKTEEEAFQHCKEYQNKEEKKMDLVAWKAYLLMFRPPNIFSTQGDNELGKALLKSGLGYKNIDCYIHSGQMEQILVNYSEKNLDSLAKQFHNMIFKSINTSYPLVASPANKAFIGYYFKRRDNYLIRFSNDGFMQVTRPEEFNKTKNGNYISVKYVDNYLVKGMNSNDITRLIFQ